jgi:hypothetical protein
VTMRPVRSRLTATASSFPSAPEGGIPDPIEAALKRAAEVCERHGLVFHLASDQNMVDDLWANVAAHMWAVGSASRSLSPERSVG